MGKPSSKPKSRPSDPDDDEVAVIEGAEGATDAVAELFTRFTGDETGLVGWVYRVHTDQSRELVNRLALNDFDELAVGREYGRGTYVLQVRDQAKKYRGQAQFKVTGPERVLGGVVGPAPAAAPAATPKEDRVFELMLAMMQQSSQQAATAAQQMTGIISAVLARPSEGLKLSDVIPLIKTDKPSALGEIVEGIRLVEELADRRAPGEGAQSEQSMLTSVAIPLLSKLLESGQAQQQPPRSNKLPSRSAVQRPETLNGRAPTGIGAREHSAPKAAAEQRADSGAGPSGSNDDARLRVFGQMLVGGARVSEPDAESYAVLVMDNVGADAGKAMVAMPEGGLVKAMLEWIPPADRDDTRVVVFLNEVEFAFRAMAAEPPAEPDDAAEDAQADEFEEEDQDDPETGGPAAQIDEDGLPRAGHAGARSVRTRTTARKEPAA